jgi:hypothetical protein|tara:strand:+ start:208 stop:390 length:183 start_codon:yes stop_codon:yes gene_type:complete
MAKKRRKVPKDKKTGVPKKYLSGLRGAKRSRRANLIKRVASLYRSGRRIPRGLLRARTRA